MDHQQFWDHALGRFGLVISRYTELGALAVVATIPTLPLEATTGLASRTLTDRASVLHEGQS